MFFWLPFLPDERQGGMVAKDWRYGCVGVFVRFLVGMFVGTLVGVLVIVAVGVFVGVLVGLTVGVLVALGSGVAVAFSVGLSVGVLEVSICAASVSMKEPIPRKKSSAMGSRTASK